MVDARLGPDDGGDVFNARLWYCQRSKRRGARRIRTNGSAHPGYHPSRLHGVQASDDIMLRDLERFADHCEGPGHQRQIALEFIEQALVDCVKHVSQPGLVSACGEEDS